MKEISFEFRVAWTMQVHIKSGELQKLDVLTLKGRLS